jgi:SAM-dependent methyltransferase
VIHRLDCRLCESDSLNLALDLGESPVADSYTRNINSTQPKFPLKLYLCEACGHLQLLDVVEADQLYENYLYESKTSLGLESHFDAYASAIIQEYDIKQRALALDIGSNDGLLLAAFKKHGLRILGVDPARHIADESTASGLETIPAFFSADVSRDIAASRGQATVVCTNNLLANIDDLDDFFLGVKTVLAHDGIYVVEFAYALDLLENSIFDYVYHEHLSYFSVAPLKQCCNKFGMELLAVKRVPTKGGSLRCIFQHLGGPRIPDKSAIQRFIDDEKVKGLHEISTWLEFQKKIEDVRTRCIAILETYRATGMRVAAYGASATSTTLLSFMGLNKVDDFEFIVDDYPGRQGLFSPGAHILVTDNSALLHQNIDAVLVLAWRYLDSIVDRNSDFLDSGGRLVVPLPEPTVIQRKT